LGLAFHENSLVTMSDNSLIEIGGQQSVTDDAPTAPTLLVQVHVTKKAAPQRLPTSELAEDFLSP
jgi:hypothetical protein